MNNDKGRVGNIAERAKRVGCWLIRKKMKTTFEDGFEDYKDKMNKLANAHEAEAFYLDVLAMECRSVASECQSVADLIGKTTEVLNDVKDGLFEGLN